MNNTTSSPMNDWIILLAVAVLAYLIIYSVAVITWRIFKFLFGKRKTPVMAIDMTNVISIDQRRRKSFKPIY